MNSPAPYTLLLLGNVSITTKDGVAVTGRAAQRHRLALLALLALGPGAGCKREKIMAYLWPESDTERARNLLNVSVYVLRQALGEDAIISELDELRLNTDVVKADVIEFDAAMAAGDHERAARLYRGPLLDTFFLNDAPDFEHWLDQERDRFKREYSKAVEALANEAERNNDWLAVIEWRKAQAAQDPYDSRAALRLMQALEAGGNPAAALQHAAVHTRLLRDELDLEAPGDIVAFEAAIRERVGAQRLEVPPLLAQEAIVTRTAPDLEAVNIEPNVRSAQRSRRPMQFGIAALTIAIIVAITITLQNRKAAVPSAGGAASVAVLPLRNLSNDPADRALAEGLTEELVVAMSRAGDVRVIGGTSTYGFRDRTLSLRRIADTLNVTHVLEGGFQKIGSRLRVQIRLVDGRDESTRWSSTYDRELRDVFAVQDEIAKSVAHELGFRLARSDQPARRRQTSDVAAYELFLRGNDPTVFRTDSGARVALTHLHQAIAKDSMYAAPHAALARGYLRTRALTEQGKTLPLRVIVKYARISALRAVALDSLSADARATLARTYQYLYDFDSAEKHLLRAVELNPRDPRTREFLVHLYVWKRQPKQVMQQAEAAVYNDPLSPTARAELARAFIIHNRCADARAELKRIESLKPPVARAIQMKAQCFAIEKNWPQAIAVLRAAGNAGGARFPAYLAYMLAKAGHTDDALEIQKRLLDRWRQGDGSAYFVAITYAGLGNFNEAFAWLDRAVDDLSLQWEIMEPLFEELHKDPRFETLVKRIGL